MDPRPVIKVVTRTTVYYGARAEVTITHHDRKPLGLRTQEFHWLDSADARNGGWPAGTRTREVVQGDGRRADFRVVEPLAVIG
jgi:hypothetical protein